MVNIYQHGFIVPCKTHSAELLHKLLQTIGNAPNAVLKIRIGFTVHNLNIENLSIAAPDMGGAKRANAYSRILGCPLIVCHKSRERANVVGSMTAIGEVEGRNVVIVDDMVDTAGTLCKAANMLKEKGALSVRAVATHPVLSGAAYENISKSELCELVVTDTIPLRAKEGQDVSKIKVISVAELFADIINKVYTDSSISGSFVF